VGPGRPRLLVTRVDAADVPQWHIADPADPAQPPRTVRYPAAGTANHEVTLWIAALDGSRTQVRWDIDALEYLPGAGWDAHGPYAVVQSRDQRTVRFLRIDQATSKTFILNEQWDHCWVQLIPGLPARSGDGAFIAHADRHGTRHLTVDGVPVTPPGLQLRAVLGVDGDEILFTASDDPAETHLWTYRPADGLRRLTSEPGVHHGTRRAGTLVHTARCAGQPGGRTTVVRPHQPPVPIGSRAERPVLDLHATPLVLGPRELRAVLYLPSWHRPGQGSLPVLANQVTAVREAARLHPELDLGRVGIRGWSFGGSLAALAVLRRPDVFPASTLRLSSALLAAGRPHEVLLLAGVGHHAIGTPVTEHLLQHQVRFLQRHLGAVPGDL